MLNKFFLSTIAFLVLISGTYARTLELTIYNDNLGLIKDQRQVQIPTGKSVELKFTDVSALIDPTSVHLKTKAEVKEQNFQYDLINQDKLLQKYLGKAIRIKQESNTIDGTLLSTEGGLVIEQSNKKLVLSPKGEIELPALPSGLIVKPTLSWLLDNSDNKTQDIELSYLSQGLSWSADYILKLNAADTQGDLTAWVTIQNQTGTSYPETSLQLVAGTPHQVAPPNQRGGRMELMMAKSAPAFEEEAFFEYHLYNLKDKTTLSNAETKQILLLDVASIPVQKKYVLEGQALSNLGQTQKVNPKVKLSFQNTAKSGLGSPLPKGKLRVYKADSKQKLQFTGEDRIAHTPKDEEISVEVGEAFDIVAEKELIEDKQINKQQAEKTIQVTLRNHKDTSVSVEVRELFWRAAQILNSSNKYKQLNTLTVVFPIAIPANGQAVLKYTVLI